MRTHSISIHSDLRASGEPKKRAGFSKPLSRMGNINGSQAADCSSALHARGTRFSPESSEALHQLIWDLRGRYGQSFVIVTHNLELARSADRVLKLFDGVVREVSL